MLKKELIQRSPIRILEKSIHGGLGKGNLGVFTARKGVGKTACMVHVSVDKLMANKKVIHISFAEKPDHIKLWYKDVFQEVAAAYRLENAIENFEALIKNRLILHFRQAEIDLQAVKENVDQFVRATDFQPEMIVVDGFSFYDASAEDFSFWKAFAQEYKMEIWFTATLHREALAFDDEGIPAPVNRFKEFLSVIIMLNPTSEFIDLKLLKDHESLDLEKLMLKLDPKTLLIANHRV
ncbi:AAA family ATPase [bacterium]|nr:AAA family ATPase [bacterium]